MGSPKREVKSRERSLSAGTVEHLTDFEPQFVAWVVMPLEPCVPRFVTPNGITVISLFCVIALFALSVMVPYAEEGLRVWMRLGVGFLIFCYAVLDCLDGAVARKRKQTSKIGEVLDHWVDAIGVPLTSGSLFFAIEADFLSLSVSVLGAVYLYNSQLVLLKHTGTFVHHTSGALAQMGTAVLNAACGVFLHFVSRQTETLAGVALAVVGCVSALSLARVVAYFYGELGWKRIGDHLPAVVFTVLAATLFLAQYPHVDIWRGSAPYLVFMPATSDAWMTPLAFNLVVAGVSLRTSGRMVLDIGRGQILRQRCTYNGRDAAMIGWMALLAGVHVGQRYLGLDVPLQLAVWLPYIAAGAMALQSALDFVSFANAVHAAERKK